MRIEQVPIQVEGSQPDTKLTIYLQENSPELKITERPLILLCPGGGYGNVSDREAEPIAYRFLAMGYHVAILYYSCEPAVYPTALLELATAMKLIKEHAGEWHVKKDRVVVQGCSAGGHLAGCLGMFWKEKWLAEKLGVSNEMLRPAGMILCYSVVTSGEYAHRVSFERLLRGQYTEEMLEKVSLEKQVTEDTPPAFIWHTYPDDCVPVENAWLLMAAMRKYNIPVEFHMYPVGGHGLSTSDEQVETPDGYGVQPECQSWIPLVQTWLDNLNRS